MQTDDSTPMGERGTLAATSSASGRAEWGAVAVLALLSAVCCTPLMHEGWFTSHDEIRPIARALAAYYEVADGDLFPRWLSTGYLGKGVPLFNFYPPAFSLLVAYAHALGVPLLLAAKLILFLLFLVGSIGVWLWVRPHLGYFPALVAGILYLFAPYHFVDLYVRGAVAEFTALAALPFLFVAIDTSIDRFSAGGLAAMAVASAAIALSHLLGALMIAPFAAVYALAQTARRGGGRAAVGRIVAGGVLGASLSAFYWLPALAERDALSPERMERAFTGYYSFLLHFVRPEQWLDPTWGFGASAPPGFEDGMSFQVGLLILGAGAASALLARRLGRPGRSFVLLALGLGMGALLLTSSASRLLYTWLQPLGLVQFPWRFLGPATLLLSAAGAGFARALEERHRSLGPWLTAAAAALAVALSAPQRKVESRIPLPDDRAAIEAAVEADRWSATFGNEDEYLPRDATVEVAATLPARAGPTGLGVEIGAVREERDSVTFDVASPADLGIAVVPRYAFPGWEVSIDGRRAQRVAGPDGLIAFRVPPGRHVARVHFGTTPPRIVGWLLAATGLGSLGVLALRERALRRVRRPA